MRAGRFARSVLTLAAGGVAAQVVVFAARPVLSRLYTPEAFGVLGEFVALSALVGLLATLRYEDAIVLPEREDRARSLLALCVGVSLVVCGVAVLAVSPRERIAAFFESPPLAPLLPLVPLVALLYAWGNASQAWLARGHRFRLISVAIGLQSLSTVAVQLLAPETGAAGLVFGSVAGAIAFALVLMGSALRERVFVGVAPGALAEVARRYVRFPRLGLPATALGQVGSRLPPLALGALFGPAVVGQFGLAAASVLVPLAFLGDAIGQVFAVHGAEAQRSASLAPLAERTLRRLLGLVLYPIAAVAILGPDLFAFVFGEPWRLAGEYARLLAPWLALSVVVPPLTRAFDATERQDRELLAGGAVAMGVVVGLTVGSVLGTPEAALLALGLGGAAGRLVQLVLAMSVAGVGARGLGRAAAGPLARAAVCIAPALVAFAVSTPLWTFVAAVAGGLVYAAWTLQHENASGDESPEAESDRRSDA